MASQATLSTVPRRWDRSIPPVLRPAVRAWLLGYASAVGPRLLTLLLHHIALARRRRRLAKAKQDAGHDDKDKDNSGANSHHNICTPSFMDELRRILGSAFGWHRLPAFCAALVGGSTLLEVSEVTMSHAAQHTHHDDQYHPPTSRLTTGHASISLANLSTHHSCRSRSDPSLPVMPRVSHTSLGYGEIYTPRCMYLFTTN